MNSNNEEKKRFSFKITKKPNTVFETKKTKPNIEEQIQYSSPTSQPKKQLNVTFQKRPTVPSTQIPIKRVNSLPGSQMRSTQNIQPRKVTPNTQVRSTQNIQPRKVTPNTQVRSTQNIQPRKITPSIQSGKMTSKNNMDFESFKLQKNKKQQLALSKGKKAQSERYKRVEGMKGGGSKYQDQRIAEGIPDILPLSAGEGEKYQDQKMGNALDADLHKSSGKGAKYQDHKIGNALKGPRPEATGERYQDHRHGGSIASDNKKVKKNFSFRKI